MKKISMNDKWICRCLTKEKADVIVNLPHDAMLSEPRTKESLGEGNLGWYESNDYEYLKCWSVPLEYKDKVLILEFEGVYQDAEVYVNEKLVHHQQYGYTGFFVNVEDYVEYGKENQIRVVAHNAKQPNSRWYSGTGIYRPVWLYVGEKEHILLNGVKIRTVSIDPASVEIDVQASADAKARVSIVYGTECVAQSEIEIKNYQGSCQIHIPDGKIWDMETPELYTCRIELENDVYETSFGIRSIAWGKDGFLLNGNRVILRGACIHHDNGILGACAFPEAINRKVRILKENGYNAIRSSHNPCSKALLDACDKQGMLLMDEYADMWYIHKNQYDYADYLPEQWPTDLKAMVEKDYNHPSVIMYCTGNEVAETAQKRGIQLNKEMNEYLHSLDATRPVTCGINIFFNFLSSMGLGVYSDEKAEKIADNAKKEEKKKPVGSEFYNTLACLVGDLFMKIGATLYPCDLKTRDAYGDMDIAGYNYGIFRYKHDLKKYPNRVIVGSETFCKDASLFWRIAKKNPRIIGDFVWSGMDYIGETGDGAAEFSDYKDARPETRMTGDNGRIDLLGKPRAEAAYTKVAFELENGPFIAVHPVYEKTPRITGWKLTKAIESWSWNGYENAEALVEVYANGETVELYVNDKLVGKKRMPKNGRVKFKTVYQDGEITAITYDKNRNVIGKQTLKTAGKETRLVLRGEEANAASGGLCFVRMQYTDAEGIWKPLEKHRLSVEVENGVLVGLGSAAPYKEGNYTDSVTSTYFGEAMAVVRANDSGTVTVKVTDENKTHQLEIPIV